MTPQRAVAVVLAIVAAAASAAAQGMGKALLRLRELEVSGLAAFSRDDVAVALLHDATTLGALQRPLDAEVADLVAQRVRELHRLGGYARAEATATLVGDTLRVALEAGPRFRCGDVECRGGSVTTAKLVSRLYRSPTPATGVGGAAARTEVPYAWSIGEFARLDEGAVERIRQVVIDAYRATGRHGARAEVELVPDGDRLRLVVTMRHEGRDVRILRVRLDGEDATVADALLRRLQMVPGSAATTAQLEWLRRELEATGRYVQVDVTVPPDAPALLDPFVVAVRLRPDAPALDAVAERDVIQVRRALDRVAQHFDGGRVLRCVTAIAEPSGWVAGARILPGRVELRWSADGVLVEAERLQLGAAAAARARIGLSDTGLLLGLGERVATLRFRAPVQVQVHTRMAASGEMDLRWQVGAWTRGRRTLDIALHPATARRLLERASSVGRDGDVLSLRLGETTVRIGPDGELLDEEIAFTVGSDRFALSWSADGLGDARRLPPRAGTPAGSASFATDVAAMLAEGFPGEDRVQSALLRGFAAVTLRRLVEAMAADAEPSSADVPALGESPAGSLRGVLGLAAASRAVRPGCDSGIDVVCTAFAFALLGDLEAANSAFRRIAERAGPLTHATIAFLWRALDGERMAATFDDLARKGWSFERCCADAAVLARGLPGVDERPRQIGAHWRTLPELRDLLGELPAGEAGDLLAWKKGLEHLWNAGGGDLLRELLLVR